MQEHADDFAVAALICGILGLVGGFIPVVSKFLFVLSILGIVFGAKARPVCSPDRKGLATAGMVLGIIGVALWVVALICGLVCAGAAVATFGALAS